MGSRMTFQYPYSVLLEVHTAPHELTEPDCSMKRQKIKYGRRESSVSGRSSVSRGPIEPRFFRSELQQSIDESRKCERKIVAPCRRTAQLTESLSRQSRYPDMCKCRQQRPV